MLLFLRIVLRQFTQSPNLTMTSTIDFSRVFLEKMKLLINMTVEDSHPNKQFSEEKRGRDIALRKDVAKILGPLFEDLNFCSISSITDVCSTYPGE